MGSVFHPQFLPAYVQVAMQYRVPPFLLRKDEAGLREMGVDAETATMFVGQLTALEAQGLPLLDDLQMLPLEEPHQRLERVEQVLAALTPGITYLIFHPAQDTPELRAIAPDWRGRVADYDTFNSEATRTLFRDSGVHVIGWRDLRALFRRSN